jgi:hypothetical protein
LRLFAATRYEERVQADIADMEAQMKDKDYWKTATAGEREKFRNKVRLFI